MPRPGEKIVFSNFASTHFMPIIGAFDFESRMDKGDPFNATGSSFEVHKHKPVSYSLVFVDFNGRVLFSKTEADDVRCLELFMKSLHEFGERFAPLLQNISEMQLSEEEERAFQEAVACHMCQGEFSAEDHKVRDHCHWSGQFLGACHNKCNLKARRKKFVPIYVHNFSGYDGHFVMRALIEDTIFFKKKSISGLCHNGEKMRTIQFGCFRFQDSMQFINSSLARVVSDLETSGYAFPLLQSTGLCQTEEQKKLLTRKGIFPYEALTSVKDFEAMTSFPPKDAFYSSISQSTPPEEDYQHGLLVFNVFKCKNMKEYMMLYNELDTVLLLESLLQFRYLGMREFGLDMSHYISLPQFGFQR